jgi:hypothetical protein
MSYSLLGTRKLHKMNPQEWLHDVFKKLLERKANHMDTPSELESSYARCSLADAYV